VRSVTKGSQKRQSIAKKK